MADPQRGAHIEFVDPKGSPNGPLLPQRVLINGVDVGFVARDGVQITPGGGDEMATVTLTFVPRKITIRSAED